MRTNFSPFRFAVCALGALCLFAASAFSQQRLEREVETGTNHSSATFEPANTSTTEHAKLPPQHAVHDWTHNHMLYPRVGAPSNLTAVQDDPRAIQHWQEGYRKDYERQGWREHERSHSHHHNNNGAAFHRDWAISLGAGAQVDNAVYPAKWTFDTNETVTGTSCTGSPATTTPSNPDYLVVPVDDSGSNTPVGASQPNIIGLTNLYSGTVPATGICDRLTTFSLTDATPSGLNTIYTGTFDPLITVGATVTVSGFANAGNNGTFTVQASTATLLTLNNPGGVAETTAATAQVTAFALSAAATASSGGTTVYTGTFSPTISVGTSVTIAGFTNAGNNGTFTVQASTTTQLTLNNPGGVAETTAATVTPAAPAAPFPLSSVANAAGGTTVYTGTFSPVPPVGAGVTVTGFTNTNNNGRFTIGTATATALTLNNPNGVAETTAATAQLGSDDQVSASTLFSYAIISDDGLVSTSPTLSLDGNLIGFVEQGSVSGTAHFHVLAWGAGTNLSGATIPTGVNVNNVQDALTNTFVISIPGSTNTSFITSSAPVPYSGTVTDLALTVTCNTGCPASLGLPPVTITGTDTFSSPYVDYVDDVAYVGNDAGVIYRIINVFCPNSACNGAGPSLDPTWGTQGALVINDTVIAGGFTGFPGPNCASGIVTGIVQDRATGNIFAGCSDGVLYGFTPSGTALTPVAIGDGTAFGGLVDAPTLDIVNGWVYEETSTCITGLTGCPAAPPGGPVLVQASTLNLGGAASAVATLFPATATSANLNLHAPAFNNAYFNPGTPATETGLIYEFSADSSGQTVLYGVTVGSGNAMTAGLPGNALITGLGLPFEISPVTDFFTPSGSADRLFASPINQAAGSPTLVLFDVTAGFPTNPFGDNFALEGTGTSGIIVDNADTDPQDDSLYFGTLGAGTTSTNVNPNSIVKLTQGGFN